MMKTFAIPMLVLSLALGGCSGCSLLNNQSVSDQAPESIAAAEKSLTIAHLALKGVGLTLIESANSGVLKGPDAVTARIWYDRADDALKAADKADEAANANGVMEAIRLAQDAIAQVNALATKK